METLLRLPPDANLAVLPSRLTASERNPNSQPNYALRGLRHPLLSRLELCSSSSQRRQLHALLLTTGLARDPFAHSRLLASAALPPLHSDLPYALRLFLDPLHSPTLFSCNTMIRAFSRSNRPDLSLAFYSILLHLPLPPDAYTFPFLLKSLAHASMLPEARQVHCHVIKLHLSSHPVVGNSLVRAYADLGSVDIARKVFDEMPQKDAVSLGTMISGYVDADRSADALTLFRSQDSKHPTVDRITLSTVLNACGKERNLSLGKDIHNHIIDENVELNVILGNSLMKMYLDCGQTDAARKVFDEMRDIDSWSWSTLATGYARNGSPEESVAVLREMIAKNMVVGEATILGVISAWVTKVELGDSIREITRQVGLDRSPSVCSALICSYSRMGYLELARRVFEEEVTAEKDVAVWNSMVSCYAQYGTMEAARQLFDRMPERNNISWTTMILGYTRQGFPEVAIDLYKDLLASGALEPDRITILSALAACSSAASLEDGESIHVHLVRTKTPVESSLGTALIDMYAKCGSLEKAIRVFQSVPEKDVLVWTALISALAAHARGREALVAFERMKNQMVKPNSVTFLSVLSACARAGLVEEGIEIYRSMEGGEHGIEPDGRHHGCVVDLLTRAGRSDEALEFLRGLGTKADADSWGVLMSAARRNGNVVLGEAAAGEVLKRDPFHDGARSLLSNLYAR